MTDPRQHYLAAVALHQRKRFAEAEPHYRAALAAAPDHPGLLHGWGVLLAQTDRLSDAEYALRRAATGLPKDADLRHHLGLVLLRLGKFEQATEQFEAVLAVRPDDAAALTGLGDCLIVTGRSTEAQHVYEKLLALAPNSAGAYFGLGTVLQQSGRIEDARHAFERAVALAPDVPAYHRALAQIARFDEGDPRLAAMEDLAHRAAALSGQQMAELHFALAKAYDDLGRFDAAFEHLRIANAAKRRLVAYDESHTLNGLRAIAEAFTPSLFEGKRDVGCPSDVPVFVVGMPRSGTSLVEQILASHPDVFGAGEVTFVGEMIDAGGAGDYPRGATALSDEGLTRFGTVYLERLRAMAPAATRIVNKLPGNFAHLGLIRLALPGARIIHVGRDARDTCLSCYSKLFLNGLDYTYELGELGRYYKAYEKLTAHWRIVLPDMLEVRYETLVTNLETQVRRLVAFCGLGWDARCLQFHETERAVRTHSSLQVRQKVFTTSIGRWRFYEKHLEPLLQELR